MPSLRRQACYWAISLISAFVFQWPFGPIPKTFITCGLNLIFLAGSLHRIIVNQSLSDSLMLMPPERARMASITYHCLLPMVLISLGYLARWCDTIYHTSVAMEHTKIHRESFIHALLAYLLVAEVEWIRHGFPGNLFFNTVNIYGPGEDMCRHIDASKFSWRGSRYAAACIASALYALSFSGLTTFINFAWFGQRGQNALGTLPAFTMYGSIPGLPFWFQMGLVAPLRVLIHSVVDILCIPLITGIFGMKENAIAVECCSEALSLGSNVSYSKPVNLRSLDDLC